MGDITCKKCGEPYGYYSIKNEIPEWDDQPDDADEKFLNGEGCPTCNWGEKAGEVSRSRTEDSDVLESEHMADLLRETDEDPMKYL